MKKQDQYYQGDVGLIRVAKLPDKAKRSEGIIANRFVLAYGEATGHHHTLHGPNVTRYEVKEGEELVSYVEIAEALAELDHQEHGTITVEPGIYKVTRQREYVAGAVPQQVLD
jgi:hypothetical protein